VDDRDRDVSPGEYAAGADAGDRDVDDRVEMSPPKEYPSSADTGEQDVDENGLQEHVDSTGDEDHDSDVISPEERDPNSEVLEAPEAADAASGAGERDGQAAGGSDGLEEAHADPNVVEKMEDQDRAEAQPDSEIGVEAGATVSEEFTEQSEHSDDDTLLIPEVPVDIVPDGLIDNGQHVRSAWHESDADRAEAPVR
jgi:hypothetical protein